jgi:uncharacterized protein (DUF2062 family)
VPITYATWWIGAAILRPEQEVTPATIKAWLGNTSRILRDDGLAALLQGEFWAEVIQLMRTTGAELWVGGLLCGFLLGLPAYFATRWGINAFRHLREARHLPHGPTDA